MNEQQFAVLSTKKIFVKCAVPGLLAMVVSSIYVLADGIFVGRYIGSNALAAVNLAFPVIMILFAIGDMVAVGSSVKIAILLGEKKEQEACGLFSAAMLFICLIGLIFTAIGFLFAKTLIHFLITDPALADLAYDYTRIFLYFLPALMPLFAVDNYLRICGKATFSMWMNISVAVLNIFLDWLFLAKMGLGISSAAAATSISMFLGVLIALSPFFAKKLTLRFCRPKISAKTLLQVFHNGSSEFFNNVSGSFLSTVINGFLLKLGGGTAVAAYGIVMYLDSLLIMALYGILDSIQPPLSYNFGAKNLQKTKEFFRMSCFVTAALSLICMGAMLLFPQTLANLFLADHNQQVADMTKEALLLFAPSYLFLWLNMVVSSFLTGMDRAGDSLLIMLFRSLIFPALFLILLTNLWGVYGVFLTPAFSGGFTSLLSIAMWQKNRKQYFSSKQIS